MDQRTIDKIGLVIKIFGAVLFAACLGAFIWSLSELIWSLTRPPVIDGPMPPDQWQQQSQPR